MVALKAKLESLKAVPKKKFNYPMTSAQEIGWDMDGEDYEVHRPKYAHNKAMCTETRYADSYVTMTSRSPFAAVRPNPAGGAPVTK